MQYICYIYVYKYKVLENIGVSFNPAYQYEMSGDKLNITHSKSSLPKDFWGENIQSLSAVIGENGAGKSTLLEFLFHICTSGSDSRDVDAVIVYQDCKEIKAYVPDSHRITVFLDDGILAPSQQPIINATYYSGYFSPYYNYNYPRDTELSGSFNMSDGYLLIKDLQDYSNLNSLHLTETLRLHLESHIAQDNARIVCLLADKDLRSQLKEYNLPSHLIITPNKSGYDAIIRKNRKEYESLVLPAFTKPLIYIANDVTFELLYYNFLNVVAAYPSPQTVSYLEEWMKYCDRNKEVLPQFESYVLNNVKDSTCRSLLLNIHKVFLEMQELCSFSKEYGYWNVEVNDAQPLKEWMLRIFKNEDFLVARYFDIVYSRNENPNMRLSTGELVVLKLFSRLFYVLTLEYEKASNLKKAKLLLLDEAEIGFHPEWQRQFINNLVDFINGFAKEREDPVQIILTSHSPFILSDIPSDCATFMQIEKRDDGSNRTVIADKSQVTTFGANLYDLFRTGYFMKSSIGEFAQNKIHELYKIYGMEDGDERQSLFLEKYEELYYIISNISDPFIAHDAQEKFYQLSNLYYKDDYKLKLQKEVEELLKRISEL